MVFDEKLVLVDSAGGSWDLGDLDRNTNDRGRKMIMGGKGSGSGGKRKGSGRKPTGKESVYFWMGTETMELLRELVPNEKRSRFVDGVIRTALKRKVKAHSLAKR